MASFRDVWNLIVTGDTRDVESKLKKFGATVDATGTTTDTTFRGRMSASLGSFAQKIPGVTGLMDKFGFSSQQAGAVLGTAVAAGASAAGIAVEQFAAKSVQVFQEQSQEVLHFKQVTGLAADEASRFVAVADDFGVSASDLSTEIGRMNKVAAASPGKLAELGIELGKTKDGGYDAKRTFYNVVDAFNATDDASKRAAIGSAAFGKNWQSMTKLLDVGSAQLEESFGKVSDFQMFSDEDLKKSEDYRHAMDDLGDAVHGLERRLGEGLVPVLAKGATELAHTIEEAEKLGRVFGGVFHTVGADAGDFFKALTNPGGYALDKVKDLGGAISDLFGGGDDGKKLAKGFENIDAQASKTTESILQSAAAVARLKEENDKAAESARIYMENNQGLRDSLDAQREAAQKATDALARYREAVQYLANEQLGLEGATYNTLDAIDAYTAKVADGDSTLRQLAESSISVQQQFRSLADQAVQAAAAQAEMNGSTLTANGAIAAQVTALQVLFQSLASDSPLRKALDEYILSLYNIPGQVHTDVDFSGTDPITGRAIGGTRREGTGAGGSAASGSAIVSDIKAYESSNGKSWRS